MRTTIVVVAKTTHEYTQQHGQLQESTLHRYIYNHYYTLRYYRIKYPANIVIIFRFANFLIK